MEIHLQNIGRRFNHEWIFKNVHYTFQPNKKYALLGINGSGKSTLLQVISGALTPSQGALVYTLNSQIIAAENYYQYLSLAAPYLELIEEFSLTEVLDFHFKFKKRVKNLDNEGIISLLGMQQSQHKAIKYFSSGMKQRVKLALSFCADTPILLLDEPTSNLDTQGIQWYLDMVTQFSTGRITIICSNQTIEYGFCDAFINIADYKTR
ncbi:MAG: ATP-binding cassette domain-containing protein [Sphingobacteriales bacterium]|jgi:ABC-type multidrug transport system ATPase subunit|nr:MAG: ATP-binding cassette domain-containing protein [Sphingobacteriales bacterium]